MFKKLVKNIPSSTRACYVYSFLICAIVLGLALYLDVFLLIAPCPLCQLQRMVFLCIGFFSLMAFLHNPHRRGVFVYSSIIGFFAFMGALLAGHHVWLQSHPQVDATSCGMGLSYLLNTLPLTQALKLAILGTGDCAKITWRMWGMSIPLWSLIMFIVIGLLALWQMRRAPKV